MKKILLPVILLVPLMLNWSCQSQSKMDKNSLPPEWAQHAIWYQIFVERFYNGDPSNDPKPVNIRCDTIYKVPSDWTISDWTSDWYSANSPWEKNYMEKGRKSFNNMVQLRRYGGDLQGVIDKLDYLSDLGINAIYLNPINDAPTLHKYDARNYHHVDVNFGPDPVGDNKIIASEKPDDPSTWKWTSADKLFLKLVEEVHKRKMRIIVDYSWNHTGTEFWAWRDLVEKQTQSVYKDWYEIISFKDPAVPGSRFKYQGWAHVKSMPEIKKVNVTTPRRNGFPYEGDINPGAKKHIFDVTRRWLAPDGDTTRGIDGFRLDVADQIPMGFWRDYRKYVKSIKPDAYLVGEIWWVKWPDVLMNPAPYVKGDVFDAIMFYQIYKPARNFFAKTNITINAMQFEDSLKQQWSRMTTPFARAMMCVSATHDSPRLLTSFFNTGKYKYNASPAADPSYKTGKPDEETYRRVRLYLVHQFTNLGAPQIWNGEEMGMWGADDPDCRKPLWWKEFSFKPETRTNYQPGKKTYDTVAFNQDQFNFYKKLIAIRRNNPVLSTGAMDFVSAEGNTWMYKRSDKNDEILVLFNLEPTKKEFTLPDGGSYLNLLDSTNVSGEKYSLEPMTAAILKKVKE